MQIVFVQSFIRSGTGLHMDRDTTHVDLERDGNEATSTQRSIEWECANFGE